MSAVHGWGKVYSGAASLTTINGESPPREVNKSEHVRRMTVLKIDFKTNLSKSLKVCAVFSWHRCNRAQTVAAARWLLF